MSLRLFDSFVGQIYAFVPNRAKPETVTGNKFLSDCRNMATFGNMSGQPRQPRMTRMVDAGMHAATVALAITLCWAASFALGMGRPRPQCGKILVTDTLDFNGDTVTLNGARLVARGGVIRNATLTGTYEIVADDYTQIFTPDVRLLGQCRNSYLSVGWFGAARNNYEPDSATPDNYGKTDSTIPIQSAIDNATSCCVAKVYIPAGAWFVRCQTIRAEQLYQGDSAIYGENAALSLPDSIELFGDGPDSKIIAVDELSSNDGDIWRTQQLIALADWSDSELNVPLADTSRHATALEAVMHTDKPYLHRKYGRHDIDIHHLWFSTRKRVNACNTQSRGHAIAINLCSNIPAGAEIAAHDGSGIQVHDCHFHDVVQAVHVNNANYSFAENGQAVLNGVRVYDNVIDGASNKAIEFSGGSRGNIAARNTIRHAECALQCIFSSAGCLIEANVVEDCINGINISQGACGCIVRDNTVTGTDFPFKIRGDAANWNGELLMDGNVVTGNVFRANGDNAPLSFTAKAEQDSLHTGYLHVRNLTFRDNVFSGGTAVIGCTDGMNGGGYQAWQIEGVLCEGNEWDCDVKIANDVTRAGRRPSSSVTDIVFKDTVYPPNKTAR